MTRLDPLRGSCDCGALVLHLHTAQWPPAFVPRACDCGFCVRHGAAWISDPHGQLDLEAEDADAVGQYRQGAQLASLVFCRRCGVLVAALFATDHSIRGAVNGNCMDVRAQFSPSVVVSPKKLSAEEKRSRWTSVWCPDVRLRGFHLAQPDAASAHEAAR